MPILNSILDHEVIGPAIREGRVSVSRRIMEKRFGTLPEWAEARLASMSFPELDDLSDRVLDA